MNKEFEILLSEIYKLWIMSIMITIGIVMGMIILPESTTQGYMFLFFTLVFSLIQMGFIFYYYENLEIEEIKELHCLHCDGNTDCSPFANVESCSKAESDSCNICQSMDNKKA